MIIDNLDLKILKGVTSDKVNALTYAYKYDETLFSDNVKIFARCTLDYIKAFRAPPTLRTLKERYKNHSTLIDDVWEQVEQFDYNLNEYTYDIKKIKERFQENAVSELRQQIETDNTEDPNEFVKNITLAIQRVTALDLERSYTQKTVDEYMPEFIRMYESRELHPESSREIKTGFTMYDELTGGVAPAELIMVGGQSNAGKSMLLNAFAKQIWMQQNTLETSIQDFVRGYNILYFSLEMPYEDCFNRFLASLANVPQKGLKNSTLTIEERERVAQAEIFIENYKKAGHYFDIVDVPRNLTIEEVELRYNDALLKYRPDVVVIDYMGLMQSTAFKNEPDWLKLGAIAASCHEFARAYDVAVITAGQLTDLKRSSQSQSNEDSKQVGMHRMGRSSLIMHHVNVAVQIETRNNEKHYPDMKIHLVKNRKGPLGEGNLIKNFANATLIDVPFDKADVQGDVSDSIPDLIKQIQEAKAKLKENPEIK